MSKAGTIYTEGEALRELRALRGIVGRLESGPNRQWADAEKAMDFLLARGNEYLHGERYDAALEKFEATYGPLFWDEVGGENVPGGDFDGPDIIVRRHWAAIDNIRRAAEEERRANEDYDRFTVWLAETDLAALEASLLPALDARPAVRGHAVAARDLLARLRSRQPTAVVAAGRNVAEVEPGALQVLGSGAEVVVYDRTIGAPFWAAWTTDRTPGRTWRGADTWYGAAQADKRVVLDWAEICASLGASDRAWVEPMHHDLGGPDERPTGETAVHIVRAGSRTAERYMVRA